jgi:hypothetical protein
MINKKKIAIILFNKQLYENSYFILIPRMAMEQATKNIQFSHGIKYLFSKNTTLIIKTTNILYLNLRLKMELQQFLNRYKKKFFGFKFKNLYFPALTISIFNYIKFFSLQKFLYDLRNLFGFLPFFIFALKKKIAHSFNLVFNK